MDELTFPLTNIQIELMKLYSTNLSDNELQELRDVLATFYANKAIAGANAACDKRALTNEDMDVWLHQKS